MVELADTPDLGSGGQPCRFESCCPHHTMNLSCPSAREVFNDTLFGEVCLASD